MTTSHFWPQEYTKPLWFSHPKGPPYSLSQLFADLVHELCPFVLHDDANYVLRLALGVVADLAERLIAHQRCYLAHEMKMKLYGLDAYQEEEMHRLAVKWLALLGSCVKLLVAVVNSRL